MLPILLVFLALFVSCDKKAKVTKSKGILRVSEINAYIQDFSIVPWDIGLEKEAEVSMGFTMKIGVPKFTSNDQELLGSTYPIDSWAFRVMHYSNGRSKELGHLYLPFKRTIRTTDSFTLKVYYQAAAASERFRKFSCPAFGHRKRIEAYRLQKTAPENSFYISPKNSMSIRDFALDHMPIIFSVGTKAAGEYQVQVAIYSHADSKLYSDFVDLGNKIVIEDESEIKVTSCIGIREEVMPLPSSREPRIEDIQIR